MKTYPSYYKQKTPRILKWGFCNLINNGDIKLGFFIGFSSQILFLNDNSCLIAYF